MKRGKLRNTAGCSQDEYKTGARLCSWEILERGCRESNEGVFASTAGKHNIRLE
jgi:hypothetical protein